MKTPEQQIDEWNKKHHEVGILVDVKDDFGDITQRQTRSVPWNVCGNAMIMVTGITGGYLLERCTPVED